MHKYDFVVDVSGKEYRGSATEENGMVTVISYEIAGAKRSATFKGKSECIAKLLLIEMINEHHGHGW